MSLISLLVALIIFGLILWAIGQLPLDPVIARILRVVAIVFLILWLLSLLGVFTGAGIVLDD